MIDLIQIQLKKYLVLRLWLISSRSFLGFAGRCESHLCIKRGLCCMMLLLVVQQQLLVAKVLGADITLEVSLAYMPFHMHLKGA